MHQHWRNVFYNIVPKLTHLEFLEITMRMAYCPNMNHRLVTDVFRVQVAGYSTADMLANHLVRKISILGSRNATERRILRGQLSTKKVEFYGYELYENGYHKNAYPDGVWLPDHGNMLKDDAEIGGKSSPIMRKCIAEGLSATYAQNS
nr:hypothetical protein B0A51_07530 [Rachicladosporium sp. CCFEE 5018]